MIFVLLCFLIENVVIQIFEKIVFFVNFKSLCVVIVKDETIQGRNIRTDEGRNNNVFYENLMTSFSMIFVLLCFL
jgi:hypothetical protein